MEQTMLSELGIDVGIPVEHADDEIKVVMMLRRNILDEKIPGHGAAFHHGLKHAEDVGIYLRLVGDERTWRVQNTRVYLPSRAGLQLVCLGVIEDSVVAFIPALQTAPDIFPRSSRLEAHERIGEVVVLEIVLR